MESLWDGRYAERTRLMKSSAIRELLKVTELPGCISFAGGLPAPEAFPIAEVARVTQQILATQGAQALQYGPTEGYYPLREFIAHQMSTPDHTVLPENVLITSGSQQALDLLGRVFLDPGDVILVEAPTYLGALQAWNLYDIRYQAIATDKDGMQVEHLDEILSKIKPKWIYALPNFQNPTGVSLSAPRRKQLIELATRYQVPIIEDDAYAQLRFEGETLPSLFTLATQIGNIEHVIHLGTFSKTLSPGLRVGWVTAPAPIINRLVQAKQGVDLHTPSFNQILAQNIASSDFFSKHIQSIRELYRKRRDLMLQALQRHCPPNVHWTLPEGGMFLWLTLPTSVDSAQLLSLALTENVAFVPGSAFFANGGGKNTMRLNFSNATPENIELGIERLGRLLTQQLTTLSVASH